MGASWLCRFCIAHDAFLVLTIHVSILHGFVFLATVLGGAKMKRTTLITYVALGGLAVTLPGIAAGEVPSKGLYSFHTGAMGSCPGLDWHVAVEPSGVVTGMVGWDQMTHVAKLEGNIQADGKFSLNAKEVNGPRTATVTGSATGNYATLTISGTGGPCDGKTVQVPRSMSGLGGGGG